MATNRILLIMGRKVLSDALIAQAKNDGRFELWATSDYAAAVNAAKSYGPGVIVVEVPESGSWRSAEKCLSVCDAIKKQIPGCKQVLLCSEGDEDSCQAAIQAKRKNRIDDFLYYDTSVFYLFSKLAALLH